MWIDKKGCTHDISVPDALPCPFCGEKDIRRSQIWFADSTPEGMHHRDGSLKWTYLECSRCSIQTSSYCYEHQALNQWNRRAAVFTRMDTGLTDKGGKPIHEGDRVKDDDGMIGHVRFGLHRNASNATADSLGFYIEWPNWYVRKELPFWAGKVEVTEDEQ